DSRLDTKHRSSAYGNDVQNAALPVGFWLRRQERREVRALNGQIGNSHPVCAQTHLNWAPHGFSPSLWCSVYRVSLVAWFSLVSDIEGAQPCPAEDRVHECAGTVQQLIGEVRSTLFLRWRFCSCGLSHVFSET